MDWDIGGSFPNRNDDSWFGGNGGWSPDRNRGWSPTRNDGWGLGGNSGWSPDRNRGWSPDSNRRSQSPEMRGSPDRSPNTSPARYRNLWAMGIDPQDYERKWSEKLASTSGTSDFEREHLTERKRKE